MYLKASLLPQLEPFFEDGNEKFVTESDWTEYNDILKEKFGTANDYLEVFDEKINDTEGPVVSSISENMADIYQDMKDFLLLYQTGTGEVMNDAVWECRLNFENFWGQKLVNSMRAIHKFLYSGEEIGKVEKEDDELMKTEIHQTGLLQEDKKILAEIFNKMYKENFTVEELAEHELSWFKGEIVLVDNLKTFYEVFPRLLGA